MPTKQKSAGGSLLELVVIVAVALGLALGIQAFLVKPYRIPSESMVPTLKVGQRVLVNRIGNRFTDPRVGDVIVFHPPKGSESDTCGDGRRRQGQACDRPTRTEASVNFIKRVVAGPGDTIYIKGGHVYRNGKRESDGYINGTCQSGGGRGCNFTTPITIPANHWFMMGDNRGDSDDSRFWGRSRANGSSAARLRPTGRPSASASSSAAASSTARPPAPARATHRARPARSAGGAVTVMAVLTEPAAEPVVASALMPAPDAIAPVAAATPIAPAADAAPAANGAPRVRRRPRTKRRTGRRLFQFDRGLGVRWIAGADEAGRGCLAGPLAAAAVLFDMEALGVREVRALSALNDSKQHDPEAREELYPVVMRTAVKVVVVSRCVRGIDGYGLHKTNLAALRDALATVARPGCLCLVDGFAVPDFGHPQRAIVDGDCTSAAIAAASIVAKVTRDRFMHRADALHPGWEFRSHVGYSTPEHRDAIQRKGVSPLHRLSFQSTAYQQLAL